MAANDELLNRPTIATHKLRKPMPAADKLIRFDIESVAKRLSIGEILGLIWQ